MVGWFIIFGLCSAFGNMSGYRGMSDCRSRGHEFYSSGSQTNHNHLFLPNLIKALLASIQNE